MPCTQITAFVNIPAAKRFVGNPGVTRFLGDNRGRILGYLLPAFLTNNYIDNLLFPFLGTIVIFDIIYPLKSLYSIAPGSTKTILGFKLLEPFIFLPDALKTLISMSLT